MAYKNGENKYFIARMYKQVLNLKNKNNRLAEI